MTQVNKTKEKLYKYQEDLERQQREEEDRLMAEFSAERHHEVDSMERELDSEWEAQLTDLTKKFELRRGSKDTMVRTDLLLTC